MNALKRSLTSFIGFSILLALLVIGVAGNDLRYSIAAVILAVGLTTLVAFGPERMGIGLMVLGMLAAPMNALGVVGNITVSDVLLVLGFGLLIPRMLTREHRKLPPLYVVGASILFAGGIVSSLLSPGPVDSLIGFVKIIAATMILILVLNLIRPSGKVVDSLAWAYVLGQIVSAAYSVAKGGDGTAQGRAVGLTTQPNFYGLGGQMAYALLIYLFYRVNPKHRWIVLGAMAPVLFSVVNSGSRASLLCCALITLAWPIVERSAVAWYWVLSGALLAVLTADTVLGLLGQQTALDRIRGDTSAQYSDQARNNLLEQGVDLFWKHPLQGNGWAEDTILAFHNAYLEVAVGGGVLTLVGFVLVVAALVRPLFSEGAPNRLAFAGLSYAAFAMIGPTLYDRIVWVALALILVAPTESAGPPGDDDLEEPHELNPAKQRQERINRLLQRP